MRFNSLVLEFGFAGFLEYSKSAAVFREYSVWLMRPFRMLAFGRLPSRFSVGINQDGICLANPSDCGFSFPPQLEFYTFKRELVQTIIPENIPSFYKVNNTYIRHIYSSGIDIEQGFVSYGSDGAIRKHILHKSYNVITDGKLIYSRLKSDEALFCCCAFDENLDLVWSDEIVVKNANNVNEVNFLPQLYRDLVIFNVGRLDDSAEGVFEIRAYERLNGKLVWQKMLPIMPETSRLYGEKIYIFCANECFVIHASNGETIAKFKHDFVVEESTGRCYGFLYPYKDCLLCFSSPGDKIQVRSADGASVLQVITVPEPYCVNLSGANFAENDGALYVGLMSKNPFVNAMQGGILMINSDAGAAEFIEATIEAGPDFYISTMLEKDVPDSEFYVVTVSHDNPEDILRHASVTLNEIALYRGSYYKKIKSRNKKHNGRIDLVIDPEPLRYLGKSDAELEGYFSMIKTKFYAGIDLAVGKILAGDGKSKYKLNISVMR